jgi:hypothetical protein
MPDSNRLPILAEEIKRAHSGVFDAAKTAAEGAIDADRALLEAKAPVKHGEWLPWLKEHCHLAERTARLYMHIAKLGLEPEIVAALGLKGAAQAIVADYPFPQPLFDGPSEERREWLLWPLLLIRGGYRPEDVQSICDREKRIGWNLPSEYYTEEGDEYRRRQGLKPMPESAKTEWREFLETNRNRPLSDIEAEIEQEARRIDALFAERDAARAEKKGRGRRVVA